MLTVSLIAILEGVSRGMVLLIFSTCAARHSTQKCDRLVRIGYILRMCTMVLIPISAISRKV